MNEDYDDMIGTSETETGSSFGNPMIEEGDQQ